MTRQVTAVAISLMAATLVQAADKGQVLAANLAEAASITSGRLVMGVEQFWPQPDRSELLARLPDAQRLQLERLPLVDKLNERVTTLQELVFDKRQGVWKRSTSDTRDLVKISQENKLTATEALNLSLSEVLIRGFDPAYVLDFTPPDGRVGLERRGRLSVRRAIGRPSKDPPFDFGVVPEGITNQGNLIAEDALCDGQPCVKLTLSLTGRKTVVLSDPAICYHYRSIRTTLSDGTLIVEHFASDYRVIGGLWVPFRREDREWSPDKRLKWEAITRLESVELNQPVPEEVFSIEVPKGADIEDEITTKAIYKANEPVTVSLTSAPRLVRSLKLKPHTLVRSVTRPGE